MLLVSAWLHSALQIEFCMKILIMLMMMKRGEDTTARLAATKLRINALGTLQSL